MKRKGLAVFLTAALCAATIMGCGSSSAGSTGGTADTSQEASAQTPVSQETAGQETASGWEPTSSITMICPWSAGGSADLAIRTLAPYLEEDLGQSVTVVNATGANGWIAWSQLLQAEPDGHTIVQMNIPGIFSGYMDPQQNRSENLESFAFVANEITDYDALSVRADDDRFTDLQSFIDYAKDNEILSGDAGVGSNQHLVSENVKRNLALQITPVHQAGWSDVYGAVLGGNLDCGWGAVGNVMQAYLDGELNVLCVFAPERSPFLPEVPTFNEVMTGYDITSPSDRGFALQAGIDPAILARWEQAMDNCINNPEFVQKMRDLGQATNYMNGEDFYRYAKEQEANMESFAELLGWK